MYASAFLSSLNHVCLIEKQCRKKCKVHSPVAGGSRLGQCADNRGNRGATRSPVAGDNRRQPCAAGSRLDQHLKRIGFPAVWRSDTRLYSSFSPFESLRRPTSKNHLCPTSSRPLLRFHPAMILDNLSSSTSKRSYFIPSDSNQSDYDLRNDCVEHDVLHPLLGAAGCGQKQRIRRRIFGGVVGCRRTRWRYKLFKEFVRLGSQSEYTVRR